MFLCLPLLYMSDIPLVSYNAILDYSLKKKPFLRFLPVGFEVGLMEVAS